MKRQGDVLLTKVDRLPDGCRPADLDHGRVVLAYGETTGHAHAFQELGAVEAWRAPTGDLYVSAARPATLVHGALSAGELTPVSPVEHRPVTINPGEVWLASIQQVFDPSSISRPVVD